MEVIFKERFYDGEHGYRVGPIIPQAPAKIMELLLPGLGYSSKLAQLFHIACQNKFVTLGKLQLFLSDERQREGLLNSVDQDGNIPLELLICNNDHTNRKELVRIVRRFVEWNPFGTPINKQDGAFLQWWDRSNIKNSFAKPTDMMVGIAHVGKPQACCLTDR